MLNCSLVSIVETPGFRKSRFEPAEMPVVKKSRCEPVEMPVIKKTDLNHPRKVRLEPHE
jgi:hypothetical protein